MQDKTDKNITFKRIFHRAVFSLFILFTRLQLFKYCGTLTYDFIPFRDRVFTSISRMTQQIFPFKLM